MCPRGLEHGWASSRTSQFALRSVRSMDGESRRPANAVSTTLSGARCQDKGATHECSYRGSAPLANEYRRVGMAPFFHWCGLRRHNLLEWPTSVTANAYRIFWSVASGTPGHDVQLRCELNDGGHRAQVCRRSRRVLHRLELVQKGAAHTTNSRVAGGSSGLRWEHTHGVGNHKDHQTRDFLERVKELGVVVTSSSHNSSHIPRKRQHRTIAYHWDEVKR